MLKGLTALVTGSTSGIGLGIATMLASEGANIVLNGFGDVATIESLRARIAGLTKTVALEVAAQGIDEVAALTAFLASDAGASITGAIIPVDGGWTAQ